MRRLMVQTSARADNALPPRNQPRAARSLRHLTASLPGCLGILFALGLLGAAGCASPRGSDPGGLASVTIANRGLPQIRRAATAAFTAAGYQTVQNSGLELVFEKKASGWRNLAYGDWSSSSVWIRVRVGIGPAVDDVRQLRCDATQVAGHGDARFEDEKPLGQSHRNEYLKLLEQVRQKLLATE